MDRFKILAGTWGKVPYRSVEQLYNEQGDLNKTIELKTNSTRYNWTKYNWTSDQLNNKQIEQYILKFGNWTYDKLNKVLLNTLQLNKIAIERNYN